MKRFNVSILAVVAVLAIGLTAFTKAEPAKGKRAVVTDCYRTITAGYVDGSPCTFSLISLGVGSSCPSLTAHLNKGLREEPTNFVEEIDCGNSNNFFCCAKLVVDATPCGAVGSQPAQPTFIFTDGSGNLQNAPAKISAIFCKPTNN